MRKVLMLTSVFLLLVTSLSAQNDFGDRKPVVFVDYFSRTAGIGPSFAEALRSKVIEGLQGTTRLRIRDVASEGLLVDVQSESAASDEATRNGELKTLGADYIITGHVLSMKSIRKVDSKGKVLFEGSVQWSIKVIDAENGTLTTARTFSYEGSSASEGDTRSEAILKTLDAAKRNMDHFVDDTFPIEGLILKVDTEKKDKAKTVIINLGFNLGIQKGQKFSVYKEVDIVGEIVRKEIGNLNAEEVFGAGRTLCKVTKGNEEVKKAMDAGQKLIVVSRRARTIFD